MTLVTTPPFQFGDRFIPTFFEMPVEFISFQKEFHPRWHANEQPKSSLKKHPRSSAENCPEQRMQPLDLLTAWSVGFICTHKLGGDLRLFYPQE
ncbi:MAG: hypothetical protein ACRCZY_01685 [Phocaeicola sp.]